MGLASTSLPILQLQRGSLGFVLLLVLLLTGSGSVHAEVTTTEHCKDKVGACQLPLLTEAQDWESALVAIKVW